MFSWKNLKRDIKEFFSFSRDIEYVEMQSESARSQIAYVTFKDSQGAEIALLLSVLNGFTAGSKWMAMKNIVKLNTICFGCLGEYLVIE
ncbi:hypothetical protein Syun_003619 [Stephania yunnanensis]|uniref:RRM domain-containing protein n=1 Tax=Stephania yunnanensis TaxID=152371 RepID=A0AAP0L1G0_9MAGN